MKISVELSMYPLNETYIPPIESFITSLRKEDGIECRTNGMSTQVFGEFDAVFTAIRKTMKESMEQEPKVVFVAKLLNTDVSGYQSAW